MLHSLVMLSKPLQTSLGTVTRAGATTSVLLAKTNYNLIANNNSKISTNATQKRQYIADASTIIPDEIEKFGKMAERWWDPTGN